MNAAFPNDPSGNPQKSYVLMTSGYNEEENIGKTIESLLAQTVLPKTWVIVSDGSVDRTDEIVQGYAAKHSFIRFVRKQRAPGRSFGSKVLALKSASELLQREGFDFIGNLDADITLNAPYFEELLRRFEARPKLGLAGGYVCEKIDGEYQSRRGNRVYSVAHAAQVMRRECYEAIGGYAVLEYGGEDWHAQTSARMHGWEIEAFPELPIYHHRRTGEADNLVRHKFRQGRMDYSLGSDVLFETLKCFERIPEKPFFIGGMSRWLGFWWSLLQGEKRPVSPEFVAFMRQEQREKLVSVLHSGGRIDRKAHRSLSQS
jgi:glycosyltransferase involved in cell wall biosynthesis